MSKVTAQQVAEHAGVSRAAVSRTLSNRGYVSAQTREKVMRSVDALGYRVNLLARSLNQQRSDIVGIVVASLDNPFLAKQVESISSALLSQQLKPLLLPTATHSISQLINMVLHYNVSGIIIASDTPPTDIYKTCLSHRIPVILINKDNTLPNVDRVVCDNASGTKMLAQAFKQRGCQSLLILSSLRGSYSLRQRELLMREAAEMMGISVEVHRAECHSYDGGKLVAIDIIAKQTLPDGIFCGNDYLALGVIDALRKLDNNDRLKQVKIAGFDNLPQAGWLSYDLTTIEQPTMKIAEAAINLLLRRMATPDAVGESITVPVSLIERGSL